MIQERWRRGLVTLASWIVVAVVMLAVAEARRRGDLYWYDVRADHRYEFAASRRLTVTVDEKGFQFPEVDDARSTAVLSLRLEATTAGRWFEPALEIVGPDGVGRMQYFERGARGLRWVNLDGLLEGGANRIELRGHHLKWDEQETQLLLFRDPPLDAGPLLVIAPHPDDAEIAAFGLYSTHDSWIVTVSAGNKPDRRYAHLVSDPAERSRLFGEMRAWDSVAIPRWGGVAPGRAVNLGYFTLTLDDMYADPTGLVADETLGSADLEPFRHVEGLLPHRPARSSWTGLVEDLVEIVQTVQPSTIVTPDPRLDGAADHKLTTIALLEALERVDPDERTLLLYTNHHPDTEYFPFGPAEGLVSLPPWTGEPLWARGVLSHPLDEAHRTRKLIAIEAQHDLRPAPRYADASPVDRVWGELTRTLGALWRDPPDSYSYLRRAPRPNELFLVVSENDGPRLESEVAGFLESLREGPLDPPTDEALYRQ